MDAKSIEWVMGQGIGAVLALVMFLVYRKDVSNALNSWQGQTKILTELVKESTKAMQSNTDAIERMQDALPHACPMADQIATGAVEVALRKRA